MKFNEGGPLIVNITQNRYFAERVNRCGLYNVICISQQMFSNIKIQHVILQFHACWNYKYHDNFCQVYPGNKPIS